MGIPASQEKSQKASTEKFLKWIPKSSLVIFVMTLFGKVLLCLQKTLPDLFQNGNARLTPFKKRKTKLKRGQQCFSLLQRLWPCNTAINTKYGEYNTERNRTYTSNFAKLQEHKPVCSQTDGNQETAPTVSPGQLPRWEIPWVSQVLWGCQMLLAYYICLEHLREIHPPLTNTTSLNKKVPFPSPTFIDPLSKELQLFYKKRKRN